MFNTRTSNRIWLLLAAGLLVPAAFAQTQQVAVQEWAEAPTVDGDGAEWQSITPSRIALRAEPASALAGHDEILVKAVRVGADVYFWFSWRDATAGLARSPWAATGAAADGARREDRLTVQFGVDAQAGVAAGWMSDWHFTADTWHWKSSYGDPRGRVFDQSTVVSRSTGKLFSGFATTGASSLLRTTEDTSIGREIARYHADAMPKYVMGDRAVGSATDVRSSAVWRDGVWQLEMRRRLDTGHADDVEFRPGQTILGSVAVSASTERGEYAVADEVMFKF